MLWLFIVGGVIVFTGLSVFFGAPYVPSHRKDVRRMFDRLLPIGERDVVLDIGSGDGIVLREASRRGARAIGYEIHPLFVLISRLLSFGDARVTVRWANAWTRPFPDDVTALYIFGVGRDEKRIVRTIQREVNRLGRAVPVVCYGNPLRTVSPSATFEAYYLYTFAPLHSK